MRDDDPFEVEVPAVGVPIRLDGPRASLDRELVELVRAEARLFEAGVECRIKNRKDTCCTACPIAGEDPAIAELCRVGRAQERVCTTLVARRHGR